MKTLVGLVVAISITLNLTGPVSSIGGVQTFQQMESQVDKTKIPDKTEQLALLEDTPTRQIAEIVALAYLMYTLGKGKYLPHGGRKEAFLDVGAGSGNTKTGLEGFTRLQEELIATKNTPGAAQPYTYATVLIGRKTLPGDKYKAPERPGEESYETKLQNLMPLLDRLKQLMTSQNYDFELIKEPSTTDKSSAEWLEFKNKLDRVLANADNIALSSDIKVGTGVRGEHTATKLEESLENTKNLHDKGVPSVLHDGRSCGEFDDSAKYKIEGDNVYGISTGTLKDDALDGLILTDKTFDDAMEGLDRKPSGDPNKSKPTRVVHVKFLQNSKDVYVKAMSGGDTDQAFNAVYVEDKGDYYRK